jgi:hypothetical protein
VPPQAPPVQTSFDVQALPSLQAVPSVLFANEQVPSPLHVPGWWHWSGAAQVNGVPAHTPLVHTSFCVHALPSLQVVPLAALGFEHAPVAGLHVPGTWH